MRAWELREAAQQALEALNRNAAIWPQGTVHHKLAQALAQHDDKAQPAVGKQVCPRCHKPAINLFSLALSGDELETVHCGCLYACDPQPPAEHPVAEKAIAAAHEQHRHYRETMRADEQGAGLSDYPPLPGPCIEDYFSGQDGYSEEQMRAYVDADRAVRGGAA